MTQDGIRALDKALYYVGGLVMADIFPPPEMEWWLKVVGYGMIFVISWTCFHIIGKTLDI